MLQWWSDPSRSPTGYRTRNNYKPGAPASDPTLNVPLEQLAQKTQSEIGWKSEGSEAFGTLGTGVIRASFHWFRMLPQERDRLNSMVMLLADNLSIIAEILSSPLALDISSENSSPHVHRSSLLGAHSRTRNQEVERSG